jgi:isoleucyl-tRNA synthetase
MVRIMAPILSFTCDEVWQHLPKEGDDEESVHLASFPQTDGEPFDGALEERWSRLWEVREQVTKALERARQDKVIGHPLDAVVRVRAPQKLFAFLQGFGAELREIFIVSQVVLEQDGVDAGMTVTVGRAAGTKCQRCWVYDTSVGADKEHPEICERCSRAISAGG